MASTELKNDFLTRQINIKREEMLDSALLYGMDSKETLKLSQELDILINLYIKRESKAKIA